jgi:hypothetical protein
MDPQIIGFGTFVRTWPFAVCAGDVRWLAESAGFAIRRWLLSATFEPSDFLFEGCDSLRLLFDDA